MSTKEKHQTGKHARDANVCLCGACGHKLWLYSSSTKQQRSHVCVYLCLWVKCQDAVSQGCSGVRWCIVGQLRARVQQRNGNCAEVRGGRNWDPCYKKNRPSAFMSGTSATQHHEPFEVKCLNPAEVQFHPPTCVKCTQLQTVQMKQFLHSTWNRKHQMIRNSKTWKYKKTVRYSLW